GLSHAARTTGGKPMMHNPPRPRPGMPARSAPAGHTQTATMPAAAMPAAAVPGPAGPEARQFAAGLAGLMAAFLAAIEEETALVRAGKLAAAGAIAARKGELAGRYLAVTQRLKTHAPGWRAAEPELFADLQRQHEAFRSHL